MSDGFVYRDILEEYEEQEKDLEAFSQAFKILERRCFDAETERFHPILDWQGADAALFVLSTCINKIQGVLVEYRDILRKMDEEEIPQVYGKPELRLVGDKDD